MDNIDNNVPYEYSPEVKSYAELLADIERLQKLVNEAKSEVDTIHSYVESMVIEDNEIKFTK